MSTEVQPSGAPLDEDFAKVFGKGKDQIVVIRREADESEMGEGIMTIFYDPQTPVLNISTINLGYATIAERDRAWDEATEERVNIAVAYMRKELQAAAAGRLAVGEKSKLLDAHGQPLYHLEEGPSDAPAIE